MKRRDLLKHLSVHGCFLLREGARHSWWHHPVLNSRSSVPRHNEIPDQLAKKICKELIGSETDVKNYYELMLERMEEGLPAEWDGTYRATSK